jgi:hypothetical protein
MSKSHCLRKSEIRNSRSLFFARLCGLTPLRRKQRSAVPGAMPTSRSSTNGPHSRPYLAGSRVRYCRSIITFLVFLLPGCSESGLNHSRVPLSVTGEVFLAGPTRPRVKVSCAEPVIIELCKLLDSGFHAEDKKDQGAAALTIDYFDGTSEFVEITGTGLVRRGRRSSQVNKERLFILLERIVKDCSAG